jgi:2-acylglycerol O-acyltransferase 2
MGFFVTYLLLVASNAAVLYALHKKALLRGAEGQEPPQWIDKFIRTWFFLVWFTPLGYYLPILIPFLLAYLYTWLDGSEKTKARRSPWVRSWGIWKYVLNYFYLTEVILEQELNPDTQYIFGFHPHGILPFGSMISLLTDAIKVPDCWKKVSPKLRVLAASFCFYVPAYRDLILAGGVVDAARFNAKQVLKAGYSIALVPGGATEALYSRPDQDVVVLRKRKGFIKLALEHGCAIVPCFTFGEAETYQQMKGGPWVDAFKHHWQRIFGISFPLLTNIIPRRVKITPVLGRPIAVSKVEKPTDKQVEELLQKYEAELCDLYKRHSHRNNTKDKKPLLIL